MEPASGLMAQLLIAINEGTALPHGVELNWYIETLERAARAVSVQGTTVELAHLRAIDELQRALETEESPAAEDG
jgi:predicted deacetylase